jgi:hypothetical protein
LTFGKRTEVGNSAGFLQFCGSGSGLPPFRKQDSMDDLSLYLSRRDGIQFLTDDGGIT